jgi:hypothetical protein
MRNISQKVCITEHQKLVPDKINTILWQTEMSNHDGAKIPSSEANMEATFGPTVMIIVLDRIFRHKIFQNQDGGENNFHGRTNYPSNYRGSYEMAVQAYAELLHFL